MRILLTGKDGQVGWELQRTLAPLGEVSATDRRTLDLADADSIRRVVREIKPSLIVNCAAYTTVDRAESEPELAMVVNGIAPGILAEEAKKLGAAIIHYSTDYVFDGTKMQPYTEDDVPNPINVYGKTKLAGERAIQAANVPYLILRTSWVYGSRGKNFLLTTLKLAQEQDQLRIVDDQVGAPTWSRIIAEATMLILGRFQTPFIRPPSFMTDLSGIYNLTASGHTSWHGFAKKILDIVQVKSNARIAKVLPVATADFSLPAKRPQNSRLNGEKLQLVFGVCPLNWESALRLCLEACAPS